MRRILTIAILLLGTPTIAYSVILAAGPPAPTFWPGKSVAPRGNRAANDDDAIETADRRYPQSLAATP